MIGRQPQPANEMLANILFWLILVDGWLGVGLWSWLRDLLILVDYTMLRVGLCWWLVVGRLYRIQYQGDQWGSSLHWAQTAYLVWKCILSLMILNSLPVTLWLKKKQFHILPMMIHFLCGAIAAQVATHLWSGEGERRGGNKYFPIFKKYLADFQIPIVRHTLTVIQNYFTTLLILQISTILLRTSCCFW